MMESREQGEDETQYLENELSLNFGDALNLGSSISGPPGPQVGWISSPKLVFLELSLIIERDGTNGSPKESHVILHISQPIVHSTDLEKLDISLISDKLPMKFQNVFLNKNVYHSSSFPSSFLVKFWADLNFPESIMNAGGKPVFLSTSKFQSSLKMRIESRTQICTFGTPIWEKVEDAEGWDIIVVGEKSEANQTCFYERFRNPVCSYVVNFIEKLRADCTDVGMMNHVLENFSVLQILMNQDTDEILLSIVYVFEVCSSEQSATTGAMYKAYRLS